MPARPPAAASTPPADAPRATDPSRAPASSPLRRAGGPAHAGTGRPRDPGIDRAALEAALELLDEAGYERMTFEAVARRAGTSKPTLYRRWPTLHALVVDALAARLGVLEPPDTGCTICDLADALKLFVAAFRRMPADALATLLAESAGDEEQRAAFLRALFDPPRAAVARTLDRARERGDLRRDVDPALLLDLLASLVHYRALFGHAPTTDAEIDATVHALLRGVASDYRHLVAVSRTHGGAGAARHHHD